MPGPAEDKKAQVQRFFGEHAAAYRQNVSHRHGSDLGRLVELLRPEANHRALDVATAAGHTAMALAPLVTEVIGADLTPQMRPEFEDNARSHGVTNVRFRVADVEALPFPDASFDLVTCRRAAHHFTNIERSLQEMARVLRPEGRLGLVDMVPPDDPRAAALCNALEAARDQSHVKAYRVVEWHAMVEAAGLRLLASEVQEELIPWTSWLYPVPLETAAAEVERVVANADPVALAEVVQSGEGGRHFRKRRLILVAVRP